MSEKNAPAKKQWVERYGVAANLLMVFLIIGGVLAGKTIKQEVFPEISLNQIYVSIAYNGAAPSEVEQGALLVIEREVQGIDGVEKVTSRALENSGAVEIDLFDDADQAKVLQDVKNAVDGIATFPEEMEEPRVQLMEAQMRAATLVIAAPVDNYTLFNLAQEVRDELAAVDGVTSVELDDAKQVELSIEIPEATLLAHGLTLQEVANIIRASSVERGGGTLNTEGGDIILRTQERKKREIEFESIPIVVDQNGAVVVRLGDIATIRKGFGDSRKEVSYNGKNAALIEVYRVGDETPITVEKTIKDYIASTAFPDGVELKMIQNWGESFRGRMELLTSNGTLALVLVMLTLGLFLQARLAFWVMLGLPVAVLGAFLFMPMFGATINMVSMFAIIITLGIVVDDAIIVGENIFEQRQRGLGYRAAAVKGAAQMAGPVTFAVLTNIVAFMPLFFVKGDIGAIFQQIPAVVVPILILSLVESLFILPVHLAHREKQSKFWSMLDHPSLVVEKKLDRFVKRRFSPVLQWSLKHYYTTIAIAIALLLASLGLFTSKIVKYGDPSVEASRITASIEMPFGLPIERAREVLDQVRKAAQETVSESGSDPYLLGVLTKLGSGNRRGQISSSDISTMSVQIFFDETGERPLSTPEYVDLWTQKIGDVAGAESVSVEGNSSFGGGPIQVEMQHQDEEMLHAAASELAEMMRQYQAVASVNDGFAEGKRQFEYEVTKEGYALGVTPEYLANQVRAAFYGAEAFRQQDGRDEVRVMIKLPEKEQATLQTVERLRIQLPNGGEASLGQVAKASIGYSDTEIIRIDARRSVAVEIHLNDRRQKQDVLEIVQQKAMPALQQKYSNLRMSMGGDVEDDQRAMGSMKLGFILSLFGIYALLAIPFSSYIQPLIVMLAIPFGFVGAIWGHLLLGFDMSMISVFGLVALTGVVINDSLVLIVSANEYRTEGKTARKAVFLAAKRRFRPILLTSVTTFFGVMPIILETSRQAMFLIPMAISIGFGVLFATFVTLFVVPVVYLIIEDVKQAATMLRDKIS